ncbi:MAG: hypothetical protein Q9216_002057 [Gyalolechia sp. 2 TL-2023]
MELRIVVTVLYHLTFALIANAKNLTRHADGGSVFNSSLPSNMSTNGTLLPAFHRNTTAGAAWVIPASPFDLGARAMICECFDPDPTSLPSVSQKTPHAAPTPCAQPGKSAVATIAAVRKQPAPPFLIARDAVPKAKPATPKTPHPASTTPTQNAADPSSHPITAARPVFPSADPTGPWAGAASTRRRLPTLTPALTPAPTTAPTTAPAVFQRLRYPSQAHRQRKKEHTAAQPPSSKPSA